MSQCLIEENTVCAVFLYGLNSVERITECYLSSVRLSVRLVNGLKSRVEGHRNFKFGEDVLPRVCKQTVSFSIRMVKCQGHTGKLNIRIDVDSPVTY